MSRLWLCALGLLAVLTLACGPSATDEADVLVSLTDKTIIPGYQAVATEAAGLEAALEGLCSMPSEQALSEARQSWRDLREPWMRSRAVHFGPVMDRRSMRLVDWFPADPDAIEALMEGSPTITMDQVQNNLASTQRGLGAIEHLLFSDDALERMAQDGSPRCDYLTALGRVVSMETEAVLAAWTTGSSGQPAYGDFLTGRSDASLLSGQAVAEVVRTQVFLLRAIVDMRLASALGILEEGSGPDPSAIPGGAGYNGLADLRQEILGMRDVYLGPDQDDLGISALVRDLSEDTDDRVRSLFDYALERIEAIEGPLKVAVLERRRGVELAYIALADLQAVLNTEVVSLLGVSVDFSDADGDSMR